MVESNTVQTKAVLRTHEKIIGFSINNRPAKINKTFLDKSKSRLGLFLVKPSGANELFINVSVRHLLRPAAPMRTNVRRVFVSGRFCMACQGSEIWEII